MEARAFHPEDKSRAEIDAKLKACGWVVQSRDEMNLSAGPGVAVREFPQGKNSLGMTAFCRHVSIDNRPRYSYIAGYPAHRGRQPVTAD